MIAQESCTQMLDGVYFCGIHHRLFVGTGHTQIEGGDDLCTDVILAGDVYKRQYLLGVNPFNQPGVESYKKNMFALLGKPGYEAQREELLKRL